MTQADRRAVAKRTVDTWFATTDQGRDTGVVGFNNTEWDALEGAIASALADARRQGMAAAAKVAETLGVHPALNVWDGGPDWCKHGKAIATAIRAQARADKEER